MHYKFLIGDDARKASRWVADRIPGCERGWRDCVVLMAHDSAIEGGVVFHDYNPEAGALCLSAAGKTGWISRKLIRMVHEYIFEHCQVAVWQVSERNDAMNKVAKRIGYTPHVIPRLRGRDEAEIIWTLTDDDWNRSRFKR